MTAVVNAPANGLTTGTNTPRINVRDKGAVGDGVTNDTPAFVAAMNDIRAAGGGALYAPKGTYLVDAGTIFGPTPPSNGRAWFSIYGDGQYNSRIIKRTAGTLVDFSGARSSDRNVGSSMCDIYLDGNGLSGQLVKGWHTSFLWVRDTQFNNNPDTGLDFVECWDSRFINCYFGDVAGHGTNAPAVRYRNSANNLGAGNFGYSTDSSNQQYFIACDWESIVDGWVSIERGDASNGSNPNGFYFDTCKFETLTARGNGTFSGNPMFYVDSPCQLVHCNDCYFYAGGKFTGVLANTVTMVQWFGALDCKISRCYMGTATDAFNKIVDCWTNPSCDVDIQWYSTTAPGIGYPIYVSGGTNTNHVNLHCYMWPGAAGTGPVGAVTARSTVTTLADADATLYGYTVERVYKITPTVARTITLAGTPYNSGFTTSKMESGDRKRIINLSGTITVTVKNLTAGGTTIRTIAVNSWTDFEFDGTNWNNIGNGTYAV